MKRIISISIISVWILFTFSQCNPEYKKLLKSSDMVAKMTAADNYYSKKDFAHALQLYEQLSNYYFGQPEEEKIQYYLAYCNYNLGSLDLASYIFKTYSENFPNSKHVEDAFYMYAYCYYLNSQGADLDQSSTMKAIEVLQIYINLYPTSAERITEANKLIDKLRATLTLKAYKNAKLYYQIQDYKAAIVALRNVIKDYPDIDNKEEIDFLILKSHYLLAHNSVEDAVIDGVYRRLKKERYESTLEAIALFKETWPTSKYLPDAESILKKTQNALSNINNI
ncbi:MAG: outer membrane protein assembly factor BamD [Bacteroidetes bacterium]|nr:outer membrane protein assembly factor BamD [Bacteroidota bacterium]